MHVAIRHRRVIQHRLPRHAVIAVRMIGRHETFVTEKEMRAVPGKAPDERRCRQQAVQRLRRRAARQADGETAGRGQCLARQPFGRAAGYGGGIGLDIDGGHGQFYPGDRKDVTVDGIGPAGAGVRAGAVLRLRGHGVRRVAHGDAATRHGEHRQVVWPCRRWRRPRPDRRHAMRPERAGHCPCWRPYC